MTAPSSALLLGACPPALAGCFARAALLVGGLGALPSWHHQQRPPAAQQAARIHQLQRQQQQQQQQQQQCAGAAPAWLHRRHAAATSAAQERGGLGIKAALRQLYKRVHPDLFAEFPAEQAENERSFKLLQEYLSQARTASAGAGPVGRAAYHFRFYLAPQEAPPAWGAHGDGEQQQQQQQQGGGSVGSGENAGPALRLVQLALAPPEPSRPGSGALSPAARKALVKLLALCGLDGVSADDEGGEGGGAAQRLASFLPEAAEAVRQRESGAPAHEVQVANLRGALRLARQVMVGFPPGVFSGGQQVELLQRLVAALDLLADDPPDLAGLRVTVASRTALDAHGGLLLDAEGSADEWADFLGGVDLGFARGRRAAADARRALEAAVARAAGVRMLFTAAHHLMAHDYREFLERLAAHAAEHGPVRRGGGGADRPFANIPVFVGPPPPPPPPPQQRQQQQQQEAAAGYVRVFMDHSPRQVYDAVRRQGPAAAEVLAAKQALQEELDGLASSVRLRLGLRRLLKDELLPAAQFRAACMRLLHHRDALLRANIEGLSVRVSDRNRVAPDGQLVDIAWNFEL